MLNIEHLLETMAQGLSAHVARTRSRAGRAGRAARAHREAVGSGAVLRGLRCGVSRPRAAGPHRRVDLPARRRAR